MTETSNHIPAYVAGSPRGVPAVPNAGLAIDRRKAPMEWDEYAKKLGSLNERISAKMERGKAIQLSPEETNLLCACGAYEIIALAAARELKKLAVARLGLPAEPANLPAPIAE